MAIQLQETSSEKKHITKPNQRKISQVVARSKPQSEACRTDKDKTRKRHYLKGSFQTYAKVPLGQEVKLYLGHDIFYFKLPLKFEDLEQAGPLNGSNNVCMPGDLHPMGGQF